jgi:hypothetical protein
MWDSQESGRVLGSICETVGSIQIIFISGASRPRMPIDPGRTVAGQPSPMQMPSPSVRARAVRPEVPGEYNEMVLSYFFSKIGLVGEMRQRVPAGAPPRQSPVQMMSPSMRPRAAISPASPGDNLQTQDPIFTTIIS